MTHSSSHLDDEVLSAHIDSQLSPEEMAQVDAHVASCADCQERLDGFGAVARLLRRMPEIDPPRELALGPRLAADASKVVRLQRWYAVSRVLAASLAAVFVLLSAGALYIDSRPGAPAANEAATATVLSAPAAAPAPTTAPAVAARAAAPASNPQAPAAGAAAARPAASPQPDDQVAAATSVRPLPTPLPTPTRAAAPIPAAASVAALAESDPAGPVRAAAIVVGVLAAVSLLVTLVLRHRLQRQLSHV